MTFKEFLKKFLLYGIPTGIILLIVAYGLACWSIGAGVKSISEEALAVYAGDTIEALMKYVDSEEQSLQQRNRAVWTLGQIGDPKALPVLEKFYTGEQCDHSQSLCQHELEKAIKACKGSFNAGRWAWLRYVPKGAE
jgi:hypothetical protein